MTLPVHGELMISRKLRLVVLDDGRTCAITNFFIDGEETDDPFEATTCVAKVDDDNWITVDLTQLKSVTFN